MNQLLILLWAVLLSILPVSELRGGIIFAVLNGINPVTAFFICTIFNVLVIFLVFFFLDFLNREFLRARIYRKFFNFYLSRTRKKVDEFEKKFNVLGFLALTIFVAVPLPGTGAWTGTFIAWLLDLDRRKSIFAISFGVLIAGLIVLLASLGLIGIIKLV